MKKDKDARCIYYHFEWKSFKFLPYALAYMGLAPLWLWAFEKDAYRGWGIVVLSVIAFACWHVAMYLRRRQKRLKNSEFQMTQEYFGTFDLDVMNEFYEIIKRPVRKKDDPGEDPGYASQQ